jgi:DNA-binding NarL/FixJ family response regulator
MTVGVMVVDDQPQFRRALQDMLAAMTGFEIVAECLSGEQSLRDFESVRPELVLMDLRMPGMGGIEATRRMLAQHPRAVVVLISAEDPDIYLPDGAMSCGAAEFVRKQELKPSRLEALWDRHRPRLGRAGVDNHGSGNGVLEAAAPLVEEDRREAKHQR